MISVEVDHQYTSDHRLSKIQLTRDDARRYRYVCARAQRFSPFQRTYAITNNLALFDKEKYFEHLLVVLGAYFQRCEYGAVYRSSLARHNVSQ